MLNFNEVNWNKLIKTILTRLVDKPFDWNQLNNQFDEVIDMDLKMTSDNN